MRFLLHLYFPTLDGSQQTLGFSSAFSRALAMITLAGQSVVMETEDRS